MSAATAPETGIVLHDLGDLLQRLTPRLLRVAVRYTRDPETGADVVQNAVEKVVRHQAQFRGHAELSTWVHRIVVNEALMWLRSDRRRKQHGARDPVAACEIPDSAPSPLDCLLAAESARHVRRALQELTADERELLERCVMQGEEYAGYGALKGLSAGAVKSRAHRARRRFETRIAQASTAAAKESK